MIRNIKFLLTILTVFNVVLLVAPLKVEISADSRCKNCHFDEANEDFYYTTPEWESKVFERRNNNINRRDWGVSYNMPRYAQDDYEDLNLFENGKCLDSVKKSGCAFLSLYQAARSLGTFNGTVAEANVLMGRTTNTCNVNWYSSPQSIGLTLVNRQDANWDSLSTKQRIMTALDNDYRVILQFDHSSEGLHYTTVYAYYWSNDPDDPTVYIRDPGAYDWKTVEDAIDDGYYLEKIVVVSR